MITATLVNTLHEFLYSSGAVNALEYRIIKASLNGENFITCEKISIYPENVQKVIDAGFKVEKINGEYKISW